MSLRVDGLSSDKKCSHPLDVLVRHGEEREQAGAGRCKEAQTVKGGVWWMSGISSRTRLRGVLDSWRKMQSEGRQESGSAEWRVERECDVLEVAEHRHPQQPPTR